MTLDSGSHPIYDLSLASLVRDRRARSRRTSSFDRSGGNEDWITVRPGETAVLLDYEGSGCVTHLYCAWMFPDIREYRNTILRCHWDGATVPSVETPLGEFFGIVAGRVREFASPLVSVNGGCGVSHGLNGYFPMPFSVSVLITIENRGATPLGGPWEALWYQVDYETYEERSPAGVELFHASFRQRPSRPACSGQREDDALDVLETEGRGRVVGLMLGGWARDGRSGFREIGERVAVDGEPLWVGSEDPDAGPDPEPPTSRPVVLRRWFDRDPLHFGRSLRWTVDLSRDADVAQASLAYWYQSPAAALPTLPSADELLPYVEPGYDAAREMLFDFVLRGSADAADPAAAEYFGAACNAGVSLYEGDFDRVTEIVTAWPGRRRRS